MKAEAFRGKVVIVTGASAGIGREVAIQLACQGAKLGIAARRAERLAQVAEECRQKGGEVLAIPTDVTCEDPCKELILKTVDAFGGLDMLVNNAGMAASALFGEFPTLDLFKYTMDVNFYGAVYCTYFALPYLKQSKGRVVMVSSMGGKAAIPYNTPYCASKYALHGFCDALRMELRQEGVSVSVICPWWVVSEFHEAQLDKNGAPRGPRGRAFYTSKTMSAATCARMIIQAATRRRREVLMGPGMLAVWLKVLAPNLVDWLAVKMFFEPAARRLKAREAALKRESPKEGKHG